MTDENKIAQARAAQPESATGTTGASIDTSEFRKILDALVKWDDVACRDTLIAHIDAIIGDLRAQLAATTENLQTAVQEAWTANAELSKLRAAPASAQPDRGAALTKEQVEDIIQAIKTSMNFGAGIFFPRGWNVLLDKLHAMRDTASPASQPVAPADHDEAVLLLSAVFDAWENGDPCYEDPDTSSGFLGMAFRLDDDVFNRCCVLLNRLNPPRNVSPAAVAPSDATVDRYKPWYDAVTDACIVSGELPWDENDARGSLERLIAWREEIALDPKVSKRAAELAGLSDAKDAAQPDETVTIKVINSSTGQTVDWDVPKHIVDAAAAMAAAPSSAAGKKGGE